MNQSSQRRAPADSGAEGGLPPEVLRGIRLFNARRYDEAHHVLQAVWCREHGPLRLLYQGIIQVGAAAIHVDRGRVAQALVMFDRARPKLEGLPPVCRGVRVARFREAAARCEAAVRAAGEGAGEPCAAASFPTVELGDQAS